MANPLYWIEILSDAVHFVLLFFLFPFIMLICVTSQSYCALIHLLLNFKLDFSCYMKHLTALIRVVEPVFVCITNTE